MTVDETGVDVLGCYQGEEFTEKALVNEIWGFASNSTNNNFLWIMAHNHFSARLIWIIGKKGENKEFK